MTPQELCAKAAEVIEERGWCRQVDYRPGGKVSMLRALAAVCDGLTDTIALGAFVRRRLDNWSICEWSDADGRTQAEVVAKLREVAGI